ncbi:zinc finger BED domain-containing protein 4-like [Scomber scombrus]|uniref:Zinc finger BED domain-containing protein 4-like n=1 Tax=Scomber scombrus TaxID=13677 RepID=A0AAV1QBM2_SCOSC
MSAVWTFFTVSNKDTRIAALKSFNATNLMSHLKNRHPEVHIQCQEANVASKQPKTKTAAAAVGSTIQQALDQTKKFAKDSAKAQSITNKVMEIIALDDQPLSIVEDRGFRQLIEHIEPRYSLPSRRYFSDVSKNVVRTCFNIFDLAYFTDLS